MRTHYAKQREGLRTPLVPRGSMHPSLVTKSKPSVPLISAPK